MSDREAMKEALRLLTKCAGVSRLWQVTDACDILRARLAAPCLEVTVDPRLTLDEAAAISSALAAPSEGIEALRRENERLRDALQWIASRCPTQFVDLQPHRIHLEAAHDAGACARAALQEVPR